MSACFYREVHLELESTPYSRTATFLDGSIVVRSDGSPNIETYSAELAAGFFVIGVVIPFKFGRFKV